MRRFRSLSRREQILAGVAGALLLLSGVYTWGIEPLVSQWLQLREQIRVQELRLLRDRRILAQGEVIRTAYAQDAQDLQAGEAEEEAVGYLLQEVDRISGSLSGGVRVRGLKPQATQEKGAYRVCEVEVEAEGTLQQLARLIYKLERSPVGLRVSRLQLGPTGEGEELEGRLVIARIVVG